MSSPTQWEPAKSIAAGPDIPILMPGIDENVIALRAYEIWQRRGCPTGSAESDWYEAEAELRGDFLPD